MLPGLYVVATPIGNLKDLSFRALECFKDANLILCEDTRVTRNLMSHYKVDSKLIAFHQHNEQQMLSNVINRLISGDRVVLVSDAGTPLIHDPGHKLVQACHDQNLQVFSIPGPCAAIAAFSISGINSNSFLFAGFLPAKGSSRRKKLEQFLQSTDPVIFYEAPHRIKSLIEELRHYGFGSLKAVLTKELTKKWETMMQGTIQDLLDAINCGEWVCKGECVVIIEAPCSLILKKNQYADFEKCSEIFDLIVKYGVPASHACAALAACLAVNKKKVYAAMIHFSKQKSVESTA